MVEIEKPRIECVENPGDGSYGKYVVEPLERGYGTTLGNSLRRILLSSLPGTAVTSIKIAGVQHEFSTIPGVKEDVTEIVLNVKSIIAKLHSEGVKTVYIEASGECEVTAGDIKADGEVEVLNPELHIATLGPDASLNMELTLSHGRGYVPADRNKPAQTIIGLIPVDSIYTPVRKVNYTVENTRVGDATDWRCGPTGPSPPGTRSAWAPASSVITSSSLPISPRPWAPSPRWWRRRRPSGTRCWS